jgi:hypothetical protein
MPSNMIAVMKTNFIAPPALNTTPDQVRGRLSLETL